MAEYPTPSDYQEALQLPAAAFDDPELQDATPRTNALGLPQPITGAFAAVFPVTTAAGRRYAAKCFLRVRPDQQARYDAVASHLKDLELDAVVPFDYQPSGIRVDETSYPLLKMVWAEGRVLNRFVEEHLSQSDVLMRLADAWAELMENLEEAQAAHGDLQHGNVLVNEREKDLSLRLVDYDTMYVPALEGWRSAEVGHRNYQHPDRTDTDFGPSLDRFSGLVIYTAIRACAARPGLWDRYSTGENMLFQDDDFYAPDASPLFDELTSIDPLASLVTVLRKICFQEPRQVPSLGDIRADRVDPGEWAVPRPRPSGTQASEERGLFSRAFLPGLTVGVLLVAVVILLGAPQIGLGVGVVITGLGLGEAFRRYQRRSTVRRQRRLEQEEAHFTEVLQGLERELGHLQAKRDEVRNSFDERREQRLDELQAEALYDCLKYHFIGEIREVEGLVHKHVVRLKAADIRTAYEATPDAVRDVRRISDDVRIRISEWRAALVESYDDEIPDELSPAEERRLRRYVDHRLEDLGGQIARTREKIAVQERERERVRTRLDQLPDLSFVDYLTYLLRIRGLPEASEQGEDVPTTPTQDQEREPTPIPRLRSDDTPWWHRGA